MSLNLGECKTPDQAFWRKLPSERILIYSKEWYYAKMCELNSGYHTTRVLDETNLTINKYAYNKMF
jgi:hypothetical protein